MSGAFEAAAGAFAVVGVADVLVRTGRELYGFLCDLAGAPEEIIRLREIIKETTILHAAAQKCQQDVKDPSTSIAPGNAVTLLESASKALNRELQSLKRLVAKFKGSKTWTRVKYVLGEAKVSKAIANLEGVKALLGSALTLACRELSFLGHAKIQNIVRQGFERAGLQVEDLSAKLDAQHQDELALQRAHKQAIISRLHANHSSNQQALVSIHRTQADALNNQHASRHIATRTQKQTSLILRTVNRADERAIAASTRTAASLSTITADLKQLLSLNDNSARIQRSGREITFLGDHQDMIMAYLSPLQHDIQSAIKSLILQHGEDISSDSGEWLVSEFKQLVGSAAQETAAQYTDSTAKPFDQWFYPDDVVGYRRPKTRKGTAYRSPDMYDVHENDGHTRSDLWSRKRSKQSNRTWSISMPSGDVVVSLPTYRDPRDLEEVSLRCNLTQNNSTIEIHARFRRSMASASEPTICAQLHVFTEVKFEPDWDNLFEYGEISELDSALRNGTISPFFVNDYGDNVCLYWATFYDRYDILDYLERQGIGQRSLNHDSSIASGLVSLWFMPENPIIKKLLDSATDTASLASQIAMYLLLCPTSSANEEDLQALIICLETLRRDWFDKAQIKRLNSCFSLQKPKCLRNSVPQLLQLLFEAGAPISGKHQDGRNMIARFLDELPVTYYDKSTRIGILGVLIEKEVSVNQTCHRGLTPSMYARYRGGWNEWCEALRRNDKNIEDVSKAEGNEWLLGNDWREEWRRRQCDRDSYLLNSDEEEESGEEDDNVPFEDDSGEEIEPMDGEEMTDQKGMTGEEEITDGEEIVHEGYQESDS